MKYYVYVLFSLKDKKLYVGFSTELKSRPTEHTQGKCRSTKARRPLKLVHYEYFVNRKEAETREEFLKSGYGRRQLKKFLKDTLSSLSYKDL